MPFSMESLESFPPDANPFRHDIYNQGTYVPRYAPGDNAQNTEWCVMYDSRAEYLILVHVPTGERTRIVHSPAGTTVD